MPCRAAHCDLDCPTVSTKECECSPGQGGGGWSEVRQSHADDIVHATKLELPYRSRCQDSQSPPKHISKMVPATIRSGLIVLTEFSE